MSHPTLSFNLSQLKAVNHWGSHLLIVAGPGTGKTHTLTGRLSALTSRLKPKQKILGLTFTNKAAEEMRHRLKKNYSSSHGQYIIDTFHGFCLKLLIKNRKEIGLPEDFSIANPEEILELVKAQCTPEDLSRIGQYKANPTHNVIPEKLNAYDICLRAKHKIDYDDVLLLAEEFLRNHENERIGIQQEFPMILVDEYQDINPIQQKLLCLWLGSSGHITVIGDPQQAIYGFRGSDVKIFYDFSKVFQPATVLPLDENFRNAPLLLNASEQVISKSAENPTIATSTAKIYKDGKLVVYEATTEKSEAEFVVKTIEDLIGATSHIGHASRRNKNPDGEGFGFGDIVILYRLKALRASLCSVLERRGIPFEITGDVPPEAENNQPYATQKVHLMTMHASKGLEFPVVFIVGCEENIVPLNLENLMADVEEERRLFYVAMTRAKERLYLVRSVKRNLFGKRMSNPPTPFWFDIEESLKTVVKSDSMHRNREQDQQFTLFGGVV